LEGGKRGREKKTIGQGGQGKRGFRQVSVQHRKGPLLEDGQKKQKEKVGRGGEKLTNLKDRGA